MSLAFESFADLIYRLSHPPKPLSRETGIATPLTPTVIFTSWLNHHRPFPPKFGKHLFRLLFPHEGSRRRYGLKETKLSRELEGILGLKGLSRWDAVVYDGEAGTGCLGREVETMMKKRIPKGQKSTLSISDLDDILDQLAALSPFSQLSQPGPSTMTQSALLARLFRDSRLSPYAMAVLTQIILRDLRPLLNPLPKLSTRNPTAMLRLKSSAGPARLDLHQAMRCWDPKMVKLYSTGKGDLDWCADKVEDMSDGNVANTSRGPVVGVNVQIPKCRKGRSCDDALKAFCDPRSQPSRIAWAETKYDGYRMQVHVQIAESGQVEVTIFSKSKRNSTKDRLNTHSIIHAALDLPANPNLPAHPLLSARAHEAQAPKRRVERSIILEAEVVPYNESSREGGRGPGIEEFWHLGAAGVTVDSRGLEQGQGWKNRNRHLCLVFFDILHLDGVGLLDTCYEERRRHLESVVRFIPGFCQIVERVAIPLWKGISVARNALHDAFEKSNNAREEGLVLKAAESTYLDYRYPWVKLKKDYIPNLGDCVDLVVLGAGWDADRARELRVDTSVFTTFYLGVLTNRDQVKARLETPHFEILFRASYGMDRSQLEVYNENIRMGRWRSKPFDRDDPLKRRLLGLSWTYHLPRSMSAPSVLFEQPLCAEVMGAGFQKIPFSQYYEIRWPRLRKIFPPDERKWTEALNGPELIAVAHQTLGYKTTTTPLSPEDDSIRAAWRSSSQACLDVPEYASTVSPSPGTKRRRMQSCPDMKELKTSPPSPPTSSPARARGPTRFGRTIHQLLGAGSDPEGSLPIFESTPTPSPPSPVQGLEPPLKVIRRGKGNLDQGQIPADQLLPTPPPSSPVGSSQIVIIPHITNTPIDHEYTTKNVEMAVTTPVKTRKQIKPLSLRSRMKIAARRSTVVA